MGTELLPTFITEHYEIHEWKHACAILKNDFLGVIQRTSKKVTIQLKKSLTGFLAKNEKIRVIPQCPQNRFSKLTS